MFSLINGINKTRFWIVKKEPLIIKSFYLAYQNILQTVTAKLYLKEVQYI